MLSYNSGDYLELNAFRPAIATVFPAGLVTTVASGKDFEIANTIDPGDRYGGNGP